MSISTQWAASGCHNITNEETLTPEQLKNSHKNKEEAAHIFQSSRVFQKFGWNKNTDFFTEIFSEGTTKDFRIHEMTNADLKKFKWEVADRESWINRGFGDVANQFYVLEARLKRLPGGKTLYREINQIAAYNREHVRTNKNRIITIVDNVDIIAKEFGIDVRELGRLETILQNARNKSEQNEALRSIKKFLGSYNSEGSRKIAGDFYLAIRDVMENADVSTLRYTDPMTKELVPFSTKHQKALKSIQNEWFQMRKDLSRTLLQALRTQKEFIMSIDRTEGGARRLVEFADRIEAYIKHLEFKETTNAKGREYDIDQKEIHLFGLDPNKKWTLNNDLGYMPHYLLTITESLSQFQKYAENYRITDTSNAKNSFDAFADMVKLFESGKGVVNRAKTRVNINQEYYSRNPLLFLSKYVHEVSSFNKKMHLQKVMKGTLNMLMDATRHSKDLGTYDEVMHYMDGARRVMDTLQADLLPQENRVPNAGDQIARFLTSWQFTRTMAFNARSAIRNYGQKLQEKIKMGYGSKIAANEYLMESGLSAEMETEATHHGIIWQKGNKLFGDLNKEYQQSQAATKGSIDETALLPGLKQVVEPDGSKRIVMADPTQMDKLVSLMEGIAQKGSVMHAFIESVNRKDTFKVAWARAHKNLSESPEWYIKQMMNMPNASHAQQQRYITNIAGKLAYGLVTDIHYEYGIHEKANILKTRTGSVLGQFQHYRMSLWNFQQNIIKRGTRDWRTGEVFKGEHSRQMIRMIMTQNIVDWLTRASGIGLINLLSNDNFEWIKNNFIYLTAERDAKTGKLTEEGIAAADKATYGAGTFSLFGPTVGAIIEFGEIMNWYEVNNTNYISMLSKPTPDITRGGKKAGATASDASDTKYKVMRLFNAQAARSTKTWTAVANQNYWKAFLTETGLYTDYKTRKESEVFWEWVRGLTGTPTTGKKPYYPVGRRRSVSRVVEG